MKDDALSCRRQQGYQHHDVVGLPGGVVELEVDHRLDSFALIPDSGTCQAAWGRHDEAGTADLSCRSAALCWPRRTSPRADSDSSMRYSLLISEEAREQLRALPKALRRNIDQRLDALQNGLSADRQETHPVATSDPSASISDRVLLTTRRRRATFHFRKLISGFPEMNHHEHC